MRKLFARTDRRLKKRAAAFFYSPKPKPGFTPVPAGEGLMGYVRGALVPKHTTLIGALDWAHEGKPGVPTARYPEDECFMNSHYATAKARPPAIYIAVGGGSVQGVRYRAGVGTPEVFLVDYDNHERDLGRDGQTEQEFEREALRGKTWAQIEKGSEGVF